MGILEGALAVSGLVLPPLFSLLKGWFMPEGKDTPEATMSTLATTKPEVLGQYVEALAQYKKSEVAYFNRDVIGAPRQWIVDLRAGIRPAVTAVGITALVGEGAARFFYGMGPLMDPGTRGLFVLTTSSWFGGRIFTNSDS